VSIYVPLSRGCPGLTMFHVKRGPFTLAYHPVRVGRSSASHSPIGPLPHQDPRGILRDDVTAKPNVNSEYTPGVRPWPSAEDRSP
jgi:hypothetical protein